MRAAILIIVAIVVAPLHAQSARRPPNIILIVADDLGYGDLGCYGQRVLRTPHLDRLANDGLRFTQFYAGSTVCAPSRCVLMTGKHTGHCLIRGNGKDDLRPEDVTVGEVLQKSGYVTGCFGKWGIGHEGTSGLPTLQGFNRFFGYLDQHHAHNFYPTFLIDGAKRIKLHNVVPKEGRWGQGVASRKVSYSHDLIMQRATEFIDAHARGDKPFFLFLPVTIPHANNEAGRKGMEIPDLGPFADAPWPEPERGFAAMVSRLDADVGAIRAQVEKHEIADDTIILFTSDNGPHSEGGHKHDYFDSNGPLRGQKRSLTEGGIRVPLIVWANGRRQDHTSDHIAGFQDFMPTFADLGRGSRHLPKDHDGVSFAPTLIGATDRQKQHDHLYWAFYERGGARAIRRGKWKAVQQPIHTPVRLYDLSKDLGEDHDLAKQHPDMVAKLTRLMDADLAPSERWKFPTRKPGR